MITRHPDFDLRDYTTFHLPAKCREMICYTRAHEDLPALYKQGVFEKPFMHMGEGSNLLFTTGSCDATVLRSLCKDVEVMESTTGDSSTVTLLCAAGATMDDVCHLAAESSLWGIENLSGIPGNVGGAAVQNVGAYGAEFKDAAVEVETFDTLTGEFKRFDAADCDYGYRWSMFKRQDCRGRYIVVSAKLRLTRLPRPRLDYGALRQKVEEACSNNPVTPLAVREAVIAMRDSKLPNPAVTGSAGSFFKNPVVTRADYERIVAKARELWGGDTQVPHFDVDDGNVKIPAAWFIDKLGWKGRTCGGAAVWYKQPLVLVNQSGEATGSDVVKLQAMIIDDVERQFGVTLHPEVIFI